MDNSITFSELSQQWLKIATLGLTYTYQRNLQSYVNHLNEAFGHYKVNEIKPAQIDDIIRQDKEQSMTLKI